MITSVDALVIVVEDLDRCAAFYGDQLGLKVKAREPGFVTFQLGMQDLTLMDRDLASKRLGPDRTAARPSGRRTTFFSVFVDDVDQEFATLKANGVRFVRNPTTQSTGQRTAVFGDPEGNLWEISHFVESM